MGIKEKIVLEPAKIKILIQTILKTKVVVNYYFDIEEVQHLIPINYDFFIPILDKNQLDISQ